MKKDSLIFSLLVTIIAAFSPMTASAQQPGNEYAIFSWQNNGDFNAFLNCDIDSITYSRVGLDGKTYSNVVVQEVWTPDSVYRIPIAAIDSVAFRAPEPVLKDGIFHITEFHYPYVTDVNDSTALTITFNASIPADSLPGEGQVVITDVYKGLLENGFAGRVISVVRTGSTVLVECEEVTLDDVYELLVCVGKSESFIDEDSTAVATKRPRYEKEGVLTYEIARWNTKIIDFEGEDGSGSMELTVIPSINLDYAICYNVKGKENHFKCVVSPTLDCDFDSNWKISKSVSFPKKPKDFVYVKIPTKVPGLVAKVGASYFVDLSGSAELNVKVPLRIQANAGYDSWREDPFFVNFDGTGIRSINGVSDGNFQIKLDGSVYTGLSLNFTVFFLHEDVANAKIGLKAGPKFSATIDFSNDLTHVPSWYDFKETKVSVEPLVAQLTASVETLFTDKLPWSSPQWSVFGSKDYFLFPKFTAPHLNANGSGLSLTAMTTDISKNLIFSVTPGIGLYQNGQLKYSYFSDSTYKRQDKWNISYLQMELWKDHPYPVGTYTAKPIFKFFGKEIEATDYTSTVTIPDTLSCPKSLTIQVGKTETIEFSGGWGKYTLTNNYTDICSTQLLTSSKTIKITGINEGTGTIYLTDDKSHETKAINFVVTSTGGTPIITTDAIVLKFGTVPLNSTNTQTFNVSGNDLIEDITLEPSDETVFQVSPKRITPAQAVGGQEVTVTYHPQVTGSLNGTITLSSSGATTKSIIVRGTCVNPSITTVPSDTLQFGNVVVGQSKTLPLKVTGKDLTGDLTVESTTTRFTIDPNTTTITPDANGTVNTTVNVTYTPIKEEKNGAWIKISGGGLAETKRISAKGRGVVPTLTTDPTSINFGTVLLGDSISKTLTITATDLTGNLTVKTTNNTRFKVNHQKSITLTPDANGAINETVTVTYKPTQAQNNGGYVVISGGGIQQNATVNLSGVCEEAYITVTPETLEFGNNLVPGKSYSQSFTLTTNVPGTLSYSLATTEPSVFTVPTIKAGSNTIKFKSSETGGYSGVINIQDTKSGATASVNMNARVMPQITVTPTSHDFGTVVKGYTATKEFTVSTLGFTSAMSLEMASSNSNFKLSTSRLGATGGSFVVTYQPSATGTHSATITISSVGPGESVSKTISLTGKCEAGYITVTPETLEFGNNLVPGKSYSQSFTLTTNVPGTLSYSLAATEPSVFTVPTIKAGTNTVKFKSSDAGGYSGVINIQDTKSGATASVNMNARVVPQITVTPTSHDFGTVVKGYTATKEFTVSTLGFTNAMSLEMASNNSQFILSKSTLGATGGSFVVTYQPTAVGTHSATITISSVGPGGQVSKTISLTGKCEAGYITVTPSTLNFGTSLTPGLSYSQSFTLTTNVPGTLSYSLAATEPSVFTVPTIKAGTNTVKFKSSDAGGYSGVINIQDTKSGATASVNMNARVATPTITVDPTSLSFGGTVVGNSREKTFTVTGTNLTGNLNLSSSSSNIYSVSPTTITKEQAAAGATVTVTFSPIIAKTYNGTVTVSGGGATAKTVTLTGDGILQYE